MEKQIRILHLEDEAIDTEIVKETLAIDNVECTITRVQTREEYIEALYAGGYDIILSDYRLPRFDGITAMLMAKEFCPDIPFIFLSGTMGEDVAIETLTQGATDYVLKNKLSRIVPAIKRAFYEAKERRERKRMESLMEVRLQIVEKIYTSDLSLADICILVLDEIESQTGSKIGFFHFLKEDQKTISLQFLSNNASINIKQEEEKTKYYNISKTKVWAECINKKVPIIHNDYVSLSRKKDLLDGDQAFDRKLLVPIIRNELIVAIISVGNKATDYDETDIYTVTHLGEFSWEIIKRKKAEVLILKERENFYKILATAPIGLLLVDSDMNITQVNNSINSMVFKDSSEIIGKRIGNGLRCIHSNEDPRGCGFSKSCTDCVLRPELTGVISEGKNLRGKEITLSLMVDGKQHDCWFNINIESIEIDDSKYFIVAIDDITEKKKLEQERLDNMHFLEGLDKVNRAMHSVNDLEKMMSNVLNEVLTIFNCDRAFLVYPVDPNAQSWKVPMVCCRSEYLDNFSTGSEFSMDSVTAEMMKTMLAIDYPLKIGPGSEYPIPEDKAKHFDIKSKMSMVLYPKSGRPWEFGIHQCTNVRIWTKEEERLFQEIGRRFSDSLNNLLMYREVNTLLRELYHRTKNNMMVICAMMHLHSHFHKNNDAIIQVFLEMENRIHSMALVHEKLYQSKNLSSINMKKYIQDEIQHLIDSYKINKKRISFNLNEIKDVFLLIDSAVPCALIINELVTNSLKYAFPDEKQGMISIKFYKDKNNYFNLQVSDNGVGVKKDFDFRINQKMGIMLVTNVVENQLMGEINFINTHGITCNIQFKDEYYYERI